jgi:hypothetical protein
MALGSISILVSLMQTEPNIIQFNEPRDAYGNAQEGILVRLLVVPWS